jgi:S-adenosylmethionine:tRNA ribosyltransferase-isomerase
VRLSDFAFELPPELIADRPAEPRDAARMLRVLEAEFEDHLVRALPAFLRPGDLVVSNDTRVLPARLRGRRGEAGIEVTLHERIAPDTWKAFARPAKKLKPGDLISFTQDFSGEVSGKGDGGEVTLRFDRGGADLLAALEAHGEMPLPPYIKRQQGADRRDVADYQTIFARVDGAVAAPTAGLHFTPALLAAIDAAGARRVTVTLHVGAGTFLPVKVETIAEHKMHFERGSISADTAAAIAETRAAGGRVLAIGTTSLRILEAAAGPDGSLEAFEGATDLFITPGYQFKIVDLLLTNFHLPRSTLFMLVSAFAGLERMKAAYSHAVDCRYRFYSYGDCCLLSRMAP